MKSFLWYISLVTRMVLTVPSLLGNKNRKDKMRPEEYDEYVYGIVQRYALHMLKSTGAEFNLTGTEHIPKEGRVLFVSNHQSNFDIGIFLALIERRKGFIAKHELLKIPILRSWMKEIHCIFMDRSDMRKSVKAINEGIKLLKDGHCLVVFPEGTRSKSSATGEFKAGSFKLATKSQAVIVPVTIDGSFRLMEANNNKIQSAKVNILVHPPIVTEGLSKEEEMALPERIRNIIINGLSDIERCQ